MTCVAFEHSDVSHLREVHGEVLVHEKKKAGRRQELPIRDGSEPTEAWVI